MNHIHKTLLLLLVIFSWSCKKQLYKDPIGLLTPEQINTDPNLNTVKSSVTSSYQMLASTLNLLNEWKWELGTVFRGSKSQAVTNVVKQQKFAFGKKASREKSFQGEVIEILAFLDWKEIEHVAMDDEHRVRAGIPAARKFQCPAAQRQPRGATVFNHALFFGRHISALRAGRECKRDSLSCPPGRCRMAKQFRGAPSR